MIIAAPKNAKVETIYIYMTTFKQCPNARDNLTVNMFEKCDNREESFSSPNTKNVELHVSQ